MKGLIFAVFACIFIMYGFFASFGSIVNETSSKTMVIVSLLIFVAGILMARKAGSLLFPKRRTSIAKQKNIVKH